MWVVSVEGSSSEIYFVNYRLREEYHHRYLVSETSIKSPSGVSSAIGDDTGDYLLLTISANNAKTGYGIYQLN